MGGRALPLVFLVAACATPGPMPASLPLRQVVLYRNGLGYFEHAGSVTSNRLKMRLRASEVDDVMKTLAVLSRDDNASIGAVASLKKVNDDGDLDLDLVVPTCSRDRSRWSRSRWTARRPSGSRRSRRPSPCG